MNYEYVKQNDLLPFGEGFLYEGIFVFWKLKNETKKSSKPTWHSRMIWDSDDDRVFLSDLTFNDSVNSYFGVYEGVGEVFYVIIDSSGEILITNFDAVSTTDSFGVTKVTSAEEPDLCRYVVPAQLINKNGRVMYLSGEDIAGLNREIKNALQKKFIRTPKNYNKNRGMKTEFLPQKDSLIHNIW